MKKIFSVDRFEGKIAVCISDDDIQLDILRIELGDLKVHDVFSAELHEGNLTDITPMPEERDRRLASNRERLHQLFNRKSKS